MRDSKHKNRLFLYGLLTLAVMCGIFYLSSQDAGTSSYLSNSFLRSALGTLLERFLPRLTGKGASHDIRKYAHIFEYACLSLFLSLFVYEFLDGKMRRFSKASVFTLFVCFLYACSDEWHQSFVPGRAGLFSDVLIDTFSALLGLLPAGIRSWRKQRRKSRSV